MNTYLSPRSFDFPKVITATSTFGHAPFFFFLTEVIRPKKIVELGSMWGYSFFCFCQAGERLEEKPHCYAIDLWEGDINTGKYNNEVLENVKKHALKFDKSHTHIIQKSFDEAVKEFSDGSIDILFIDGFHTYDAVKNDFETWRSKVSDRGVILFHDICVEKENFGVKRFWQEIKTSYPSFEFHHDHGLGVLLYGSNPDEKLIKISNQSDEVHDEMRFVYRQIGSKCQMAWDQLVLEKRVSQERHRNSIMQKSISWKITNPLRKAHNMICGK